MTFSYFTPVNPKPWQQTISHDLATAEEPGMLDGTVTWQGRVYDLTNVIDVGALSAVLDAEQDRAISDSVDEYVAELTAEAAALRAEAADLWKQVYYQEAVAEERAITARVSAEQASRRHFRANYPSPVPDVRDAKLPARDKSKTADLAVSSDPRLASIRRHRAHYDL